MRRLQSAPGSWKTDLKRTALMGAEAPEGQGGAGLPWERTLVTDPPARAPHPRCPFRNSPACPPEEVSGVPCVSGASILEEGLNSPSHSLECISLPVPI